MNKHTYKLYCDIVNLCLIEKIGCDICPYKGLCVEIVDQCVQESIDDMIIRGDLIKCDEGYKFGNKNFIEEK